VTVTFKGQNIGGTFPMLSAWGDIAQALDGGEDYPNLYGVPFEECDDEDAASQEAQQVLDKHRDDLKPDTVSVLEAIAQTSPSKAEKLQDA
jgi:hypothetical protein